MEYVRRFDEIVILFFYFVRLWQDVLLMYDNLNNHKMVTLQEHVVIRKKVPSFSQPRMEFLAKKIQTDMCPVYV